ncbi:MAG: TRAP transporter substrate-binding protein [Desulfomonile sp.]|nr:TRAP transporter substrate-binding protein [Desulfomonile sp.]
MKRLLGIHLLVLLVLALICTGTTVGMAQDKVITLKVSNWFPVGSQQDLNLQQWGKDLEQRSGGRVKVNYFSAGTLVPAAQSYDATVKGIVDVSNCVLGYTMGRFPFCQVLDLPMGWPVGPGPTKIVNEFFKKFKPKEFDDVKVLWAHQGPGGFLHSRTKPITKLEDIQGMKLRCYGSNAKFVGLLGGAAVAMPMPEVYDALSKGVVDGLMSQYEPLQGFRTGEHIKYSTENRESAWSAAFVVVMNKQRFNSLPPDIQKIIEEMTPEYIEKYDKMWTETEAAGKEFVEKRGVKILSLSPEEEARWYEKASQPLIEAYIKEMKAKGLPGEEAVAFLKEEFKKYKK